MDSLIHELKRFFLLAGCAFLAVGCGQGELGSRCVESDSCDQGSEIRAGFAPFCSSHYLGGQCSQECESSEECAQSWGEGAICIGAGFCVRECEKSRDCPKGSSCNEFMWCERDDFIEVPGRAQAEQWARAYCDAAFMECECTEEDYVYGFSREDCYEDQRSSFLIALDRSELVLDQVCFNDRLAELLYLGCGVARDAYDWKGRTCPVFHGRAGYKEQCSGGLLASQCAQGLVCQTTGWFEGQCEEDFIIPGEGEDCQWAPFCQDGLLCVNGTTCMDFPDVGEPCECDEYRCDSCANGWCNSLTLTCAPPKFAGDTCDVWDQCDTRHGDYCGDDGTCIGAEPIACSLW